MRTPLDGNPANPAADGRGDGGIGAGMKAEVGDWDDSPFSLCWGSTSEISNAKVSLYR
jgi:hypothetical protein